MPSLTFLVVDDNELQRRVVDSCLEAAGHTVMFATNADEVAAALEAHNASVVIMAAALPADQALACVAAARRPRRDPKTFALLPPPVVVIGHGERDGAATQRLLNAGAAGTVPRPYDRATLARKLALFSVGAAPAIILVIDDSKLTRNNIAEILEEDGHEILCASDGRDGLSLLRDRPDVDLVMSDIIMPNLDGYAVCQAIRSSDYGDDLPIILLTSLDDIASQSRAVEAGADEFLTKPISRTELKMRVRTTLRLKGLQRRLHRRNEDLEAALKLREQLSEMLVHDFRNPLARILVSAEMLAEDCREAQVPSADLADEINDAATRLCGLADDLLEVAKIEDGVLRPDADEIALDEIVTAIVGDMRRIASVSKVNVRVSGAAPVRVRADRKWIYRVLQNLIDNAIRYTPRGGSVTLSVTLHDSEDGSTARIEITDTGMGIPEELRESIFERFSQIPHTERHGVGLGLTFCRLAIEAHGGTIAALPRADGEEGTTFAVELPIV